MVIYYYKKLSILFLYNTIKLVKLNLQINCAKEKIIMRKCNAKLRKNLMPIFIQPLVILLRMAHIFLY